jgi:hypothetical protein
VKNIKDKYKVAGRAALLVGLLVFILFASVAGAGNPEPLFEARTAEFGEKVIEVTPPDLPRAQEVIEEYGVAAIEVNPRHPLGEIVEVTSQREIVLPTESEHFDAYEADFGFVDDSEWLVRGFVTSFVGGFALSNGLMEYLQYYSFDEDGVPRVGVTSKDFVEEFQKLDFTIRFEIIDPDEVEYLERAAREIQERPYVAGACYSHLRGRIVVDLTSPSYDRYMDIYREYPRLPFRFYFLGDPQPEPLSITDHVADDIEALYTGLYTGTHGGGEKIYHGGGGGTSSFLADFFGWSVMVTYGHGTEFRNVYSVDYGDDVGATAAMIGEGIGNDAGFYLIYPGVTFGNVIYSWVNDKEIEWTWDVDGWVNTVTEGQSMWYASGYRGLVNLTVEVIADTYLRYTRNKGGGGDSGSPLFYVYSYGSYCFYYVHGLHTHQGPWWDPSGRGHGTRIAQVQNLLNVDPP